MKRYILYSLLACLLILIIIYRSDIVYGIGQARGQLRIINNTRSLTEVLNDPSFPDSLKTKIRLIQDIRKFAIDSLGVNDTENYTTLFDQKGKPVLWAVNASLPYEITAYEWCFPIAGCFPYKGYFEMEKAVREEEKLKAEGYDTYMRNVDGWSTLGFFKDPILSNMLTEDEGELAELIIHELTHATLYIRDSADYNENLATFVGNYGALEFLQYQFGDTSEQYRIYKAKLADSKLFDQHIMKGIAGLSEIYAAIPEAMTKTEKDKIKQAAIRNVFCSLDLRQFGNPARYAWADVMDFTVNNAWFSQYLTYHEVTNQFEWEFREKFNSDFRAYLTYLKKLYGET